MKEENELDILIPVFNEDETIVKTIKNIKSVVKYNYNILICYDYDEDPTLEVIKENFFNEWAIYKGDKRALNSYYERLVNNKERFAPDAETLILKIAKSTSIKFQRKVANHYSN